MRHKVVIIGHGYTSRLAVIRSVAQIGCDITVIVMTSYKRDGRTLNISKPIDCNSKYVNHVYYCHAKDEEGLIKILLSQYTDSQQKIVIIPDSDFSVAVIDKNQERLKGHFLFPHIHNKPGAVVEWMNKVKQKNLACEVGLNISSSCVIDVKEKHFKIPVGINYPCFTKPLATIKGGKRLFRRCDNEKELHSILDFAITLGDLQVLVEDYKHIDTEYALVGFSDGKEVVIPAVFQILEMAHGGHYGVACKGKVLPVRAFEDLINKFKEMLKRIGYVGLFDIDFYQSKGTMYFSELNLRFGGSGYAVTHIGVNLPAMFVNYICGESIDDMNKEVVVTATYSNERMCLDDWYGGYITTAEFKHIIKDVDINFIYDYKDQKHWKAFCREYRIKYLKRLIKIIIGKINSSYERN